MLISGICKNQNLSKIMRRLKFYHAYKWYMQKSESVQDNETIKIFTMLTSGICKNQNLSKRMRWLKFLVTLRYNRITQFSPNLVFIKKKRICHFCGFCRSSGPQRGNKIKQKDRLILGNWLRAEEAMEREGDGDSSSWCFWNGPQRTWKKETVVTEGQRRDRDHPD